MTERELGNFSKWPLQELIEKERSFPIGHLLGNEIRAEINRRRTELGSGLIDHSQKMTTAAMHMADMNV